jgi:MFS transporter, FSR family, fosmidomycin resistance protein
VEDIVPVVPVTEGVAGETRLGPVAAAGDAPVGPMAASGAPIPVRSPVADEHAEPWQRVPARARGVDEHAELRPRVTLGLLAAQHGFIHAQTALLPLVFIAVMPVFGIGVGEIGLLLAAGNVLAGVVQVAYAPLQRVVTRRTLLGVGGILFGAAMTATAFATTWAAFSAATIVARVAGSPQHPVGNALIAEQHAVRARASAIAVHIAGGNLGTVAVPLAGAWVIASFGWPIAVAAVGIPAVVVGVLILLVVRESGTDRAAALAHGSVRAAFADVLREPDLRRLFAASSIAAAGRGIGVVATFVPLYLSRSLDLDAGTVALMYTLLLAGSVPGPLIAGRLAGRYGHRVVLAWSYVAGALALVLLVVAGGSPVLLWLAIALVGAFVFEEASLLQGLLVEAAPPQIRDAANSAYFTLMFIVGAAWAALLGALVAVLGDEAGFPVAFGVMAASYLVAIAFVLRMHAGGRPAVGEAATPGLPAARNADLQ